MIIDAHVHLSTYQDRALSLNEVLLQLLAEMIKNGIQYAIVIPDNIEDDPAIADLAMARKLLNGHPELFLLGSPKIISGTEQEVEKYRILLKEKVIKGIKLFPGHDPYYPTDERCFPYYKFCEELGAPIVIHTGANSGKIEVAKYSDPKLIIEVATRYPQLKIIITHYNWPDMQRCYDLTRQSPNIYFELAALADEEVVEATGGLDKIKSVLKKTIADRPDQVIFGTDWPMCKIENHIKLIKELNLPREIEEKIMYKNAVKTYNLSLS